MFTMISPTAITLLLLGTTQGHVIMNLPTPLNYHGGVKGPIEVDPLNVSTNPFPCQGRADSGSENPTVITAGTAQLVNFTGGAQHAGGSCQFSISYQDPLALDARNWRTIYSIIGGCPLQKSSSDGNVHNAASDMDSRADAVHCGNDLGLDCLRQFDIPIPKELKNGKATFAWTWFNVFGNREMYMNCAPVEIRNGSDNLDYYNSLHPLYVETIAGQSIPGVPGLDETGMCLMSDENIINIPNPGVHGRILETPANFTIPINGNCTLATVLPTFVYDSLATTAEPTTSANVVTSTKPGGVFVTEHPSTTASSISYTENRSLVTVVTRLTTPGSGTGSASSLTSEGPFLNSTSPVVQPPQPSGSSTCGGKKQPWQGSGYMCFDDTHFGLCDQGCALPQLMSSGTMCRNGQIVAAQA